MKNRSEKRKKKKKDESLLVGLGLDGQDEHVRITNGDNFHLVGGSKETHERMQEHAIKFNEELSKRGKRLEEISGNEFQEISERASE